MNLSGLAQKFPSDLKFLRISALALALFLLSGGHWALLQGVAWTQMIQAYSSQGSLQQAVEKTWSGRYPCSLCKKISSAQQREAKNSSSAEKKESLLKKFLETSLCEKNLFLPRPFLYPPCHTRYYTGPVLEPPKPYL